jgi:hypothetical protein
LNLREETNDFPICSFPEQSAQVSRSSATVLSDDLLRDAGINDKSRKVVLRGKQVIVPLKFDEDGNPATVDKLIFKRLNLNDLRFLGLFRKNEWDVEKTIIESGIEREKAERLIKKVACFREEDAKVKALCEIPTPSWISAKHVQNVYEGGTLEDSEHKSLQELAKIEGAYKNNVNLNVTQNVFNLPKLTPDVEEKFKKLAEEALQAEAS